MKLISVLLMLLLLSACSAMPGKSYLRDHAKLTDHNPQNFQGCTVGHYESPDGQTVTWWDCKDKAHVAGSLDLNGDGQTDFTYSADDVIGSDAAAIRAEVEQAFTRAGVEIIPAVVDGIVEGLKPPGT